MIAALFRAHPIYLAGFVLLILLALVAGVSQRKAVLELTETEIIETYAARYLATVPDGALTDCRAKAGAGQVRMIVICGPEPFQPGQHFEYHVAPLGQLLAEYGPQDWTTRQPVAGRDRI